MTMTRSVLHRRTDKSFRCDLRLRQRLLPPHPHKLDNSSPMSQVTIQQAIDLALDHHRAGRLHQAEQLYRQVLAADPENAWALQLLGMIAYQVGNPTLAIQLIQRAIAIDPTPADFHNNLGEIFRNVGRLDEAEATFMR